MHNVQGLAGALVAGAIATSSHADIANGSFEDGLAGWTVMDNPAPFFPTGSYAAGTVDTFGWGWTNTPTDGTSRSSPASTATARSATSRSPRT